MDIRLQTLETSSTAQQQYGSILEALRQNLECYKGTKTKGTE